MIDNFEQIKKLLKFESEDAFYFLQIIKRKKEHPELGSNSYIVKTYYVKSLEQLDFYKGEMICLANYHNARVCIDLNRRSFERIAFHNLKKVADQIMNKDFKSVRNSYNSVCGSYSNEKDKRWIIDIDHKNRREINDCLRFIENLQPVGPKFVDLIETKNGFHLITTPFNIKDFLVRYKEYEVHKQNPTILYIK